MISIHPAENKISESLLIIAMEPHVINVGLATVEYRKAGSGPPLVLLHGYPVTGETWRFVLPELSRKFTCYAFDLVGFGGSASPDDVDSSSQGEAKVIYQALSSLGISNYSLLGNDSGGWIARELALLDARTIQCLLLTNTEIPGHRPPWIESYQKLDRLLGGRAIFRTLLRSKWWRESTMGFGGCFCNRNLIEGDFFEKFLRPMLDCPDRLSRALRFLARMNFRRMDEFQQLHRVLTMPVAFVWGASDETFPETLARDMAKQFPNVVQFTSVPQGKVFMHEEYPEVVAKSLLESLSKALTT